MMRWIFTLITLLLTSQIILGQKETTHWIFGGFSALDFSCETPQLTVSGFDGLEGGASISSPTGELLFYTNGDVVWNKNHQIMPNGRGLGGLCSNFGNYSSASQSALIVPHPGNSNLYYIFTTDCAEDNFVNGLRYSIVDISLENGRGDVTTKNQLLVSSTAEKVAAIFKDTAKNVWIVTHGVGNNNFYSFLLTSAGLNTTPLISSTGQVNTGGRGYMKFSPDGNQLVVTSFIGGQGDGVQPELFTFDKTSGEVKSNFVLPNSMLSAYGASFSPNSKVLYLTCAWTCGPSSVLYQYNLEAGTPLQIAIKRYVTDITNIYGALQLGPDGKLYCLTYDDSGNNYIGVVQNPDLGGKACNAVMNYIPIPCTIGPSWGLPNFIESYFQTAVTNNTACTQLNTEFIKKVDFDQKSNCQTLTATFINKSEVQPFDHVAERNMFYISWDFGDGTFSQNTLSDHPNLDNITHTYQNPGTYTVTLTLFQFGCGPVSVQKQVVLTDTHYNFSFVQDCNSLEVEFINNSSNANEPGALWHWDFDEAGNTDTSNVVSPIHIFKKPGTYNVGMKSFSECSEMFKLPVKVYDQLNFSLGNDSTLCFDFNKILSVNKEDALYLWNDGSTNNELMVTTPGTYILQLKRKNCEAKDTIQFQYAACSSCPSFENLSLGYDTLLCLTDSVILTSNVNGSSYLWSNGSENKSLTVYNSGNYWLELTRGNCIVSDTIFISTRDCEACDTFVPNVFTPNDDVLNQEFKFMADCDYSNFNLEIINRWGEKIHTGTSPVWNGMIGNVEAPVGVYYYMITYSITGPHQRIITRQAKGWVHLLR
jgi:gliding motility-associated-like protein